MKNREREQEVTTLRLSRFFVCWFCFESNDSIRRCGDCKTTAYCSRLCQAKDWTYHRQVCRELGRNGSSFFKTARYCWLDWLDVESHQTSKFINKRRYQNSSRIIPYRPFCFICGQNNMTCRLFLAPIGLICIDCIVIVSQYLSPPFVEGLQCRFIES